MNLRETLDIVYTLITASQILLVEKDDPFTCRQLLQDARIIASATKDFLQDKDNQQSIAKALAMANNVIVEFQKKQEESKCELTEKE